MNIFHRHPDAPPEKIEPIVEPLPAKTEKPSPVTAKPISLSPLEQANLAHALYPKVAHALKDLPLNKSATMIDNVVGGARQSPPDETLGRPIV